MTFKINDAVTAAVFINGKELLLDNGNYLQLMHIRAGALDAVPTLRFDFVDGLNLVPTLGLNDGSQLEIHINSISKYVRKFRVYSWRRGPMGDGFAYSVNAYWDAPQYFMGSTNTAIRDSSYSALNKIATKCGLQFSTLNNKTSDAMLWIPGNKTYAMFARDIARYGFLDDTSHMVLAIDSQGTMRYRDINKNAKPSLYVGPLPPDSGSNFIFSTDFAPITASGSNNFIGGYMHERYPQSAIGSRPVITKLVLDSDSRLPLINSKVRTAIERSGISYSPIDFGNLHDNYDKAKVQNTRYNLLNSMKGEFLFPIMTAFETADNFNYVSPSALHNNQYDGEYTVVTKIIFISGSDYNEKIVAVKNGLNS